MPDKISLNADLGEGFGAWTMGDDAAMLRLNAACEDRAVAGTAAAPRTTRW